VTTSSGPARRGHAGGVERALADVRQVATAASETLLDHVPDTGDHATGRAVDDFVEQASDALRALAESLGDTVTRLGAAQPSSMDDTAEDTVDGAGGAADDRSGHDAGPRRWVR